MPAINFQKQFVDKILSGTKRSTIRQARRRGQWRAGDTLYLYNGLRTKHAQLLKTTPCVSVTPIVIDSTDPLRPRVIIADESMHDLDVLRLAQADGFDCVDDFMRFFAEKYGDCANLYLIEW